VHRGSLTDGHYFSYNRLNGSNLWVEMNEHKIKDFDSNLLDFFCFGGKNQAKPLEELWQSPRNMS
jgi:hypothetical protein